MKQLREEAKALERHIQSPWVKDFLLATDKLPEIAPRTIFFDAARTHYYSEAEAKTLSAEERGALQSRALDEQFYYNTRYGTPLAYARPLDLVAAGGFRPDERRILDFGYGGIGQMRLLASLGADVVGVEVDPLTRALYSAASDQGPIARFKTKGEGVGRLRLVHGKFPADVQVKESVGTGYDLFIAKNVLKRGYIHPEQPVSDRQRIDLGVDDAAFLKALFAILAPGGRVMIYNICPAPAPPGKPYIPWADGRSPFPATQWEEAGFRVLAFDKDDSAAARAMAHALGWDAGEPPMDLEKDLFAHYTLVEKPASEPTK